MAIKGIEAQLMITRAADYTKDTSVMQRRGELMRDYLTVQQKVAEAQEKQKVPKTIEPEEIRLHPDDDAGGRGGSAGERRSGAKKGKTDGEEDKPKPGAVVMSEERLIDIKI